jgi:uracil-DNA glycosylase
MKTLWEDVRQCRRCRISQIARNKVFGDGNVSAKICLIGEAPGADEDRSGHVFVGNAGRILTSSLYESGIDRRSIFIHNALKCHPAKDESDGTGNRKPTNEETSNCRPFLYQQLLIIRPKFIVVMGDSALRALVGTPGNTGITKLFGMTIPFTCQDFSAQIVVTFHPQYIGYNESNLELKRQYVELFRAIRGWAG